jgi:hypothetical protein
MTPEWTLLRDRLAEVQAGPAFQPDRLTQVVPEPVARYLAASIAPGTPLARAAVLTMRGSIKIGRWLPFRARQLLAPTVGTVWEARVAGVIAGSDRYVNGVGGMDWRLLRFIRLIHADGEDVTRSAAERAAGESIWVPTALAASTETAWSASNDNHISVEVTTDGHRVVVEHDIDANGRLCSSRFPRWGDPDGTGAWDLYPFGVEATSWARFGGLTIPSGGQAGWHYGTDRWADGVFFRFEITGYELLTPP